MVVYSFTGPCFIDIKITDSLSKAVYDKINEKGYLGVLAKIEEEEERLSFIKSSTDISSAIFEITNGKDFKQNRMVRDDCDRQ